MSRILELADAYSEATAIAGFANMKARAALAAEVERVEADNKRMREALEDIVDPIVAMQRDLPEGYSFNGAMALSIVQNPEYYKSIARAAIGETK